MLLIHNGTPITILNDGSFVIAGKTYIDGPQQALKGIEDKLKLFTDANHAVHYDDIPKRLQMKINRSLSTIFERLDENRDEGVVAINKLRDFGFLPEDNERIRRVSEQMGAIAYDMGLSDLGIAYERFKEHERQNHDRKKAVTDFIDRYWREDIDSFPFFNEELQKQGLNKNEILREYNNQVHLKERIGHFMTLPEKERAGAFIDEYRKKNLANFGYFDKAMHSFGLSNDEIFKRYREIETTAVSEKLTAFYNYVRGNRIQPDREKIAKFVTNYKHEGQADFAFFSETLQDFGLTDQHDILREYNDSIDESFRMSTSEFSLVSVAKKEFIELQEQIIRDAVESGLDAPTDLPRFVSPSDRIKDETINPQKIKMIAAHDFTAVSAGYLGDAFDAHGNLSRDAEVTINKNIALQQKIIHIANDGNTGLVNLQLIKNNGFSYDKMKEWALYSANHDIVNPQRAMMVAITGLKQCNKLVECGILATSDNKNFTFTSPRSREILFENPDATYNELADMVIEAHEIKYVDGVVRQPVDPEVFVTERREYEAFLDAQYQSYYAPQGLTADDFLADASQDESQEYQRYRDMCPELRKGIEFAKLLGDYFEESKYDFVRVPKLNFEDKNIRGKIEKLWGSLQKENREKNNEETQKRFIYMSAIRFGGISHKRLLEWASKAVEGGHVDEETAAGFIESTVKEAKGLVEAGILTENRDGYKFTDNYSREILLENYEKELPTLQQLNRGVKVEKRPSAVADNVPSGASGLDTKYEDLLKRMEAFNFSWSRSGDERYRSMMRETEDELSNEFILSYQTNKPFKKVIDDMLPTIKDVTGATQAFYDAQFDRMAEAEKHAVIDIVEKGRKTESDFVIA